MEEVKRETAYEAPAEAIMRQAEVDRCLIKTHLAELIELHWKRWSKAPVPIAEDGPAVNPTPKPRLKMQADFREVNYVPKPESKTYDKCTKEFVKGRTYTAEDLVNAESELQHWNDRRRKAQAERIVREKSGSAFIREYIGRKL